MKAAAAERLIVGEGVPDALWMRAPQLGGVPETTVERLLADAPRLVVLSPHPDDEVLGVGGVLAGARSMGREVQVLSATDGEACYPGDTRWSRAELAQVRRRELRDALHVLGTGIDVHHLGMPDGGLATAAERLHGALASHLRGDDLLLVPWHHDGHPDHEAAAHAGLAIASEIGCRCVEYPIWGWHWASPDAGCMPLDRALRIAMSPDIRARKRVAIDSFASQLGGRAFDVQSPVLPPWARLRFERPFEVLFA